MLYPKFSFILMQQKCTVSFICLLFINKNNLIMHFLNIVVCQKNQQSTKAMSIFTRYFCCCEKKSIFLCPILKDSTSEHRSNSFLRPNLSACTSYIWLRASATYIRKENADNVNSFQIDSDPQTCQKQQQHPQKPRLPRSQRQSQPTHLHLLWWWLPSRLLRREVVLPSQLSRNTSPPTTRSMLSN